MNFLFSFFHKKDISWVIIRIEIKMKSSALLPSNLPSVIDRSNLSPSRETEVRYNVNKGIIFNANKIIVSENRRNNAKLKGVIKRMKAYLFAYYCLLVIFRVGNFFAKITIGMCVKFSLSHIFAISRTLNDDIQLGLFFANFLAISGRSQFQRKFNPCKKLPIYVVEKIVA